MDLSIEEVGPTEDTILALLDFLVDPLLPSKSSSSREAPSSSKEQLVAKQVHAVVLLYNYYHRKRHQGLEFLDFESFCKMAMALKPSLLLYLRLMQTADHTQLNGSDKEHSLTEKAIMNACEICKTLDTLKNNPSMDSWPITGVAVFLVDDKKENCYLFHSSITQGVWSVIEKDVEGLEAPSQISEAVIHSRSGDKKRIIKRTPKENRTANETSLQQHAYAAVKEACGINLQSDLKILENHVVYSINKEKEAVRLYIMQCTLTNQETNLVPVNDAVESLQGPLVTKESISWITTPVVEYFHLLPFADKILDWLSREGLLSVSLNSEVQKEPLVNISQPVEVVMKVEHNGSTNPSNHSEAINGVEDHKSQLKEEPLANVDISQPVEVAMEVEHNDSSNSSNHFETINAVEDHNSELNEEPLALMNIPQPVEVAMEVEHNDSSNPSNHFETINAVEDHNSQLNEEPLALMNIPQPVEVAMEMEHKDSSDLKEEEFENTPQPLSVDMEVKDGSSLNTETSSNPSNHFETINAVEDQNSQLNEEPLALMNIPQPVEVAMEMEHKDSSDLKEEEFENTPQPLSVDMEVKDGSSLNTETSSNPSNHFETINAVEDHNSQLNEEPLALMNIPQPVEVAMEMQHKDSSDLKEEEFENTPQPLSVDMEVKDGSSLNTETSSNPSNHFETINAVEDHNSQLNEEPLALMNIPQPVEVAMEMQHKDSSDLKEEEFENTPQPLSVDMEVKDGSSLNTETTLEVEENNSSLLMEGPLTETSQPSVVANGLRNGNCQLKEQHLLYSSPHSETTKEVDVCKISHRKEKPSVTIVYTKRKRLQTNCISNKSPGSKKSKAATENPGKQNTVTASSNNTNINEALVTCLQTNGKNKSIPCENHGDDKKQLVLAEETDPIAMSKGAIVAVQENECLAISYEDNAEMVFSDNEISACAISNPDEMQAGALVSFDSNQEPLQKIQLTIASKDTLLTETALKVLFKKRERLSHQLRITADEIALCDRNIQTILNGGENDLGVKLDAMIEACNSECLRIAHETEDNTNLQMINLDLPLVKKRKKLSQASLCVYSPCQELDEICNANSWTLPTYNVSASEGGFQSSVMMKGADFECSSEGNPCPTPLGARNLAASELLLKLRSMAAAKSQI